MEAYDEPTVVKAGLTVEGDMEGMTPVALLRGQDGGGTGFFLRLGREHLATIQAKLEAQEAEAERLEGEDAAAAGGVP